MDPLELSWVKNQPAKREILWALGLVYRGVSHEDLEPAGADIS